MLPATASHELEFMEYMMPKSDGRPSSIGVTREGSTQLHHAVVREAVWRIKLENTEKLTTAKSLH